MKRFLMLTTLAFFAAGAYADGEANLDKGGVILQGFDAVSYFQGVEPRKGNLKIQTQHEGATYLFASEENKAEFLKSPSKYAPKFGGWCAYAVADSKSKVDIDPKSFLIQDGRLLVFYNGFFGDTRKKWTKDPKAFLQKADLYWPETRVKEP